jgi:hypothetical protein
MQKSTPTTLSTKQLIAIESTREAIKSMRSMKRRLIADDAEFELDQIIESQSQDERYDK